ncbi:hypothetical protein N2152v2_002017 [Parachlorella kessleri]
MEVAGPSPSETLRQRSKGLQAAALTNSPVLKGLCTSCGVEPCEGVGSPADQHEPEPGQLQWPEPHKLAQRIARRLGVPFFHLTSPPDALPKGLAALDAPMPGNGSTLDLSEPLVATTSAQAAEHSLETACGAAGAPLASASAEDTDEGDMLMLLLDCSPPPAAVQVSQDHYHQQQQQQQQQVLQSKGRLAEASAPTAADLEGSAPQLAVAEPAGLSFNTLEWLDSLLRALNQVGGFRDTVLLSVVLGLQPAAAASVMARLQQQEGRLLGQQGGQQAAQGQQGGGPRWPIRRPLQSYQFRGTEQVAIRHDLAALVVHRLAGVIRKDAVQKLDVEEVLERGGGGCILAQRLLPEVAYKLGRAPKYGA